MGSPGKSLCLLPEDFVVLQCPLNCHLNIPQTPPQSSSFFSVTVTPEERSVIIPENLLAETFSESDLKLLKRDDGWKCYKVEGNMDFGLVGILHAILEPLKSAGISVLAVGTYNTDYFLVKADNVEKANREFLQNGFILNNVN